MRHTKKLKKDLIFFFWRILKNNGIKRIFGLPGGPIDLLLSNKPTDIIWTNTGNELQNGFISQIYGKYTDSVGILFVTTGPGIATAISALEQSIYEGSPLLIISTVNSNYVEGDFQQWDILKVSKTLTKHVFHVKHQNQIGILQQAYDITKQLSTGSILLFEQSLFKTSTNVIYSVIVPKSRQPILNFEQFESKKNLVVIGTLSSQDYKFMCKFIKINNIPFVTTWKGRFKMDSTLNCGRVGSIGNHSANYAILNATNLLIVGNIPVNVEKSYKNKLSLIFTEDKFIYSLCYNQLHSLKESNVYEVDSIAQVLDKVIIKTNQDWIEQLKNSNALLRYSLTPISELEKYANIAARIYEDRNLDIPVTTGVGNHWYAIGKYMETKNQTFESCASWASIGVGISNGIAMHYATNKEVWVFEGDGGTRFSSCDLLYLLNNPNLPITVTIYVNHVYGAIEQDYEIKHSKFNEIIEVPPIPVLKDLPNCHFFKDINTYYKYLYNNYHSNKLRFIIILLPNKNTSNDVYEINIDKEYEKNLKTNDFTTIMKTKLVL